MSFVKNIFLIWLEGEILVINKKISLKQFIWLYITQKFSESIKIKNIRKLKIKFLLQTYITFHCYA